MPRPRDQRLYFELQGKLTQQEVDYNNMHQHHTIVRAPQGKETKFGKDQYHKDMKTGDFQDVAGHRAPSVKDFKPVNEQQPSRKASEPKKNGDAPLPSKSATQIRTNNLPPLPTEPPRVVSTNQAEASKEALKRNAPNQNVEYSSGVAGRVKERHQRDRKEEAKKKEGESKKESVAARVKAQRKAQREKKVAEKRGKKETQARKASQSEPRSNERHKKYGVSYDMMD